MWRKAWNGGVWLDWESLGEILTSAPGAYSRGENKIDVAYRAADHSLAHKKWDGDRWTETLNYGNVLTSAPSICK